MVKGTVKTKRIRLKSQSLCNYIVRINPTRDPEVGNARRKHMKTHKVTLTHTRRI